MPVEIKEAQQLYKEYKLDLALQSLNKLSQGQMKGLPIEIQLQFHMLKGKIFGTMENNVKAVPSAEIAYEIVSKYEEFYDSFEKIDAILLFAEVLLQTSKFEKCAEILEEIDMILAKLPEKLDKIKKEIRAEKLRIQGDLLWNLGKFQKLIEIREESSESYSELEDWQNLAGNYTRIGFDYYFAGDMDEALNNLNKSKQIWKKNEVSPFFKNMETYSLLLEGVISTHKGDLIEGLNYLKEALNLAEEYHLLNRMLWSLHNIGDTYLELADWGKAIVYYNKSLKMAENLESVFGMARNLEALVESNLIKGEIETAKYHLERIRKLNDQESNKRINQSLRLCEALLLRKSSRIRDLGRAQEMLKEITKEDLIHWEISLKAMINLCEMLVLEFKDSKDPEVITEINPIMNKLLNIAESQQSYWIMAETLLLKAKVATISLNLTEARHLVNQAQIIAEKHGLKNLAIKISMENDELIKNLAVFEKMKLENEPMEQRLDKVNIEKQLNDMLHKNKFEIPELQDEDPVLIMLMSEGGIPLYTHVFQEEWNVKDQLFGGFLSAFNSFSAEIFSKGFDRAVFGDYSILMNSIENIMIAYIFLGPSYLAKQKFTQLTEKIQKSEAMQKKLHQSKKTGQELHPNEMSELEVHIHALFVQKDLIL